MEKRWYIEWGLKSFYLFLFFLMIDLSIFMLRPEFDIDGYFWMRDWFFSTPWLLHVVTAAPLVISAYFFVRLDSVGEGERE